MARAFVFPGQGSQHVGMGTELARAFAAAREVFEEVDDALGRHLRRLMAEGPEDELTLTENAQPALMAASVAVLRVLERESGKPVAAMAAVVAGHSLGEYSALVAAGSLPLAATARLLRLRGEAMQRAVPVGEGAMAALLGLDIDEARAVAAEAAAAGVCAVANDNAPGQVVVSGEKAAVDKAMEVAARRGAKRSVPLPVSAPFHSPLMRPAARRMAEALEATAIRPPEPPLIANVTARAETEPARLRALLVEQVTATVRWRESVLAMKRHDVDGLAELGCGKVLAGLARRIDRELDGMAVRTPAEVETLLERL